MTQRAGIIGGGIGGLATAIMLQRAGWTVRVCEKAPTPVGTGTALGMWPESLRALDVLGLGEEVRQRGARQHHGNFLRPDGTRIARLDVGAMARRSGDSVYLISRPALLGLLAGALAPGTVAFDSPVTDLAAYRTGFDVVVAADGVFSRTRTAIFGPGSAARYVGATAWRGTVDGATDSVNETWGRGQRFGITPREDGRTNWYASALTPPGGRSPEGELAALRARFGDWHAGVRQVLSRLRPAEILRHDLYHLAPSLPTYLDGNVVLIGDAAHAMTPDLGRGAGEALVDAVTLGRCLIGGSSIAAGLAEYENLRRRPTQRLARLSHRVGRVAQARRFTPVRDAAVRLALSFGPPA
ncbi:FAD-dependent monooxygenase [Micromonospora sp. NBC_01796]|uniref:FAD-dependent monooxygenase n=1 Tax=Micromonospora sp. NBC_01796 TaxID=2975987 RepID=UPI002DD7A37B|nr:FAD-dependent monooxygenase [Micromonospora sp. NBC_01796]WSA83149.1 FAD-dependent monooxygenase [Micromonospora sp. NBC_01796]